jgi:hypothetical protein
MPKIYIKFISFPQNPIAHQNLAGVIHYSKEAGDDTTITFTLYKDGIAGEFAHTTMNITSSAWAWTIDLNPGNYTLIGNDLHPLNQRITVVASAPTEGELGGDILNAGFIPITSVGADSSGFSLDADSVIISKSYDVALSLRVPAPRNYSATLKLGYSWNKKKDFSQRDIVEFLYLMSQKPIGTVPFVTGSTSGNGTITIDFNPADFPDWTFSVLAIPDMLLNTNPSTYKPIIECAALN